jgi:hypothetical protein
LLPFALPFAFCPLPFALCLLPFASPIPRHSLQTPIRARLRTKKMQNKAN